MSLGLLLIGEVLFFYYRANTNQSGRDAKTYGVAYTVKHQKNLAGIQLNSLTSPLLQAGKYVSHSWAVHGGFEKFCIYWPDQRPPRKPRKMQDARWPLMQIARNRNHEKIIIN
jgi:hypothetical protein